MTLTLNRATGYDLLTLPQDRSEAVAGTLTIGARIGWAFKPYAAGSNLTRLDVLGPEGCRAATETIKASFYLSPSGRTVIGLRPVTEKGKKMLKVVANIPLGDVRDLTVIVKSTKIAPTT